MFALFKWFLYVSLHTMWSVKSLQLLCVLPFGMLCLSGISMMFADTVGSVYGGPVRFGVYESPPVLL